MGSWAILNYVSSYFFEYWISEHDNIGDYLTFIWVSCLLLFVTTFMRLTKSFILLFSSVSIARRVNRDMVSSLSFASISTFFDRVPIGRILNRFMKDTDEVDISIPFQIDRLLLVTYDPYYH